MSNIKIIKLVFLLVLVIGFHYVVARKKVSPEVAIPEDDLLFIKQDLNTKTIDTSQVKKNSLGKASSKLRKKVSPEVAIPEDDLLFIKQDLNTKTIDTSQVKKNSLGKASSKLRKKVSPEVAIPEDDLLFIKQD